ncbi:hypothetical protein JTE90_017746 [Oedothorax gibbosus]|uniref:Uncharacterized protein n=1 Tax=Oedothorax gibbosus TaxID=931172 RepID=A0AAV6TJB4_9ARAC|nr:hypothetical protein JTE90_017746 [Oedothorax gibbosus]
MQSRDRILSIEKEGAHVGKLSAGHGHAQHHPSQVVDHVSVHIIKSIIIVVVIKQLDDTRRIGMHRGWIKSVAKERSDQRSESMPFESGEGRMAIGLWRNQPWTSKLQR